MNNKIAILTCFKNESHILEEWINHYKNRGIDHIYMINDFSTDNYIDIIQKYIDIGFVTLIDSDIVTNQTGKQIQLYNKYFTSIVKEQHYEWFFILDLDEFLYSPQEIDLKKIIKKYDNYSQLKICWQNFGSNDFTKQPKNIVNNFTKRCKFDENKEFISYKCGFKSKQFINFNIHEHNVCGETKKFTHINNDSELIINHYAIQSLEYFLNKKTKIGDINNWPASSYYLKPDEHIKYFKTRDTNDILDIRLKEQNLEIIQESILEDDVTVVITCCDRSDLLKNTLDSFIQYNTYPIKKFIIIEDSGKNNINDFCICDYPNETFELLYNEQNIGQVESIDKAYSLVKTKWIFHCEEDWCFIKKGFIEESLKIFNKESSKLFTVWLRPHNATSDHPVIESGSSEYKYMHKSFSYKFKGIIHSWCGFTFNPGLRRTKDALLFHLFTKNIPIDPLTNRIGEYMINSIYQKHGYYAAITNEKNGYCKHIGEKRHVVRPWD